MAREFTTEEKATILCQLAAESMADDSGVIDWFDQLWSPGPGYAPPKNKEGSEFIEWQENILDEWNNGMEGLSDDEVAAYERYL